MDLVARYANPLLHIGFETVRIIPLFAGTAGSPFARLPLAAKPATILVLAITLARPYLVAPTASIMLDTGQIIVRVLENLILGIGMALGLAAAFSAAASLMRMLDVQIGFGAASLFDPQTRIQESLLASGLTLLMSYLFFELDVYQDLLTFLVAANDIEQHFAVISASAINSLLLQFGTEFSLALLIALPTMVALLMVDLVSGMLSKTMPQMNVYFVALPLKIGMGLFALSLSLRGASSLLQAMFEQTSSYWGQLLGGLS